MSGPEHSPPPPPPESSRAILSRKVVSTIIALIVVALVLYAVFVPRFIEQKRDARYDIVSEYFWVWDSWDCLSYGQHMVCQKRGWVRHIDLRVTIRAVEKDAFYGISYQLTGGYNSSVVMSYSPTGGYIHAGEVRSIKCEFDDIRIPEDGYQSGGYDFEYSISPPKVVEKERQTIFEWLTEGL
ncbi:MAG: hypothetical protein LN415_09360 [Candidatus Thermoplasmatota archaeon]|nr:hypothetical protein [Candidatus Thermoplasmatota archaeon]